MPNKLHLIFVYGTLKSGFCRNHYLDNYRCLGEFSTKPLYRMVDCGNYPGLILVPGNGISIQGEIYEVDDACLRILAEVEGLDIGLYVQSTIEMMASFDLPILGYLYNQNTDGFPDCGDNWTKKTVEGDL